MRESQGNAEEYEGRDSYVRIRAVTPPKMREEWLPSAQDQFTHRAERMNDAILNTALIRNLRDARFVVSMGESQHGAQEPQVDVQLPRGTHCRKVSAACHALAALIELATPPNESWVVHVDADADEVGCVYLEIGDGRGSRAQLTAEARRSLQLLERVVP